MWYFLFNTLFIYIWVNLNGTIDAAVTIWLRYRFFSILSLTLHHLDIAYFHRCLFQKHGSLLLFDKHFHGRKIEIACREDDSLFIRSKNILRYHKKNCKKLRFGPHFHIIPMKINIKNDRDGYGLIFNHFT